MRGFIAKAGLALAALFLSATDARAQDPIVEPEPGTPTLGISLGFTADPGTFLLALEVPFAVAERVSFGPLLQLGLSDDDTIVAPTANARYAFDLSGFGNPDLKRLRPMIQGGVGFAYIEKDGRRGDDDDIRFMFNVGGGVEYFLTDRLALGSTMMFNILPDDAVGENFFYSWQVGTMRFLF